MLFTTKEGIHITPNGVSIETGENITVTSQTISPTKEIITFTGIPIHDYICKTSLGTSTQEDVEYERDEIWLFHQFTHSFDYADITFYIEAIEEIQSPSTWLPKWLTPQTEAQYRAIIATLQNRRLELAPTSNENEYTLEII